MWREDSTHKAHGEAILGGIVGRYLVQPLIVLLFLDIVVADGTPVGGVLMADEVEQIAGVVVLIHEGLIVALLAAVIEEPCGDLIIECLLGDIFPQAAGVGGGIKRVSSSVVRDSIS